MLKSPENTLLALFKAQFFVRRGDAARDAKDWTAARVSYRRALKRDPSLAPIWVQYGHALKESHSLDEAEAAYRRALSLEPHTADTHLQLGHLFKLTGRVGEALAFYARAAELDPHLTDARRELRAARQHLGRTDGLPDRLRYVILGTTGMCNASCIHCPTGKAETAHVPKTPMPMPLFRRILEQIHDQNYLITDQVSFGLFGDGLVDPHVIERARLLRTMFPDVRLSVNTNGAAFNAAKHAELAELATVLALHCESVDPATYNYLMQPLRFERVVPKFNEILKTFAGKVLISVPVSRANYHQLADIRAFFTDRGASEVVFDPLISRCAENTELFDKLALGPRPIRCGADVLDDLIVDCDGSVLVCCQDFRRLEPIGQLATESLEDVLRSAARKRFRDAFTDGRHTDFKQTCNICFGDDRGAVLVD